MAKMKLFILLICSFFFIAGFGKAPEKKETLPTIETKDISSEIDAAYGIANQLESFQKKQLFLLNISKQYAIQGDYKKAEAVANSLKKNDKVTPQYVRAISEIAVQYAAKNNMEGAIATIESLETLKDKDFAYENLILFLINKNMIGNSLLLIDQTKNTLIRSRLQHKIASYYIQENQLEEAKQVIAQIESKNEHDQILSQFIIASSKESDTQSSIALLSEISNQQVRENTTQDLVMSFANNGLFDQALDLVNTIDGTYTYQSTLVLLIQAYAKTQKFETAYQLSESLKPPYRDQGISEIVIELAKFGQIDNSINLSRLIEDTAIKQNALKGICISAGEQGLFDQAIDLSQQLRNSPIYEETVVDMATTFGHYKEYLYPSLLLKQIQPNDVKMKAFSAFVISYSEHKSLSQTLTILSEIHNEILYTKTVEKLLHNFIAPHLLQEAIAIITSIPLPSERCSAFLTLSQEMLVTYHDRGAALQAANEAAAVINSIQNDYVKNQVQIKLASTYLHLDETKVALAYLEKVEKYLNTLETTAQKDDVITTLIPVYIEADEDVRAIKLIEEYSNPYSQIHMLLRLDELGIEQKPKYDKYYKSIVKSSPKATL